MKDCTPDRRALDDLFSLVYEELKRLASSVRRREFHETMNTTALVHETWLKLKDSPTLASISLPHFKSIAIRAMRQVLVEEARRRMALKRSGESVLLFDDIPAREIASSSAEIIALDAALAELASLSSRQVEVVERRFFGGESVAEVAAALDVSESVVERDWRAAKAWLAVRIRQP
jgi:RNA polymerase sigma factor (TIGR02999 family)